MGCYFNNVDIITLFGCQLSEMSDHLLRCRWEEKFGAEIFGQDPGEFRKRGLPQFSQCYSSEV